MPKCSCCGSSDRKVEKFPYEGLPEEPSVCVKVLCNRCGKVTHNRIWTD